MRNIKGKHINNPPSGNQIALTGEVFLPVEGLGERYEVSNFGRVYATPRMVTATKNGRTYKRFVHGGIMPQQITPMGYCTVAIYTGSTKFKQARVHRLVMQAFKENPHQKPHVNHIDGDKTNNLLENLEWCTHQENAHHAVLLCPRRPRIKCLNTATGEVVKSIAEAHRKLSPPYSCRQFTSRLRGLTKNDTPFVLLQD